MFDVRPRPKKKTRGAKTSRQSKLKWEDVQEDRPELAAFLKARQEAARRASDKSDLNFWVCLVFQSHGQRDEFLKAVPEVPVAYNQYLDGEHLALRLGLPITPCPEKPFNSPLHKKLTELVLERKQEAQAKQRLARARQPQKGVFG